MSAANVEAFLARIYVDEKSRLKFLKDPDEEAKRAGLSNEECEAVKQIDRVGLAMMATSLERKKQKKRFETI
jgi:hypothetical protein